MLLSRVISEKTLTKKEQALSEVNYHDLESEATREYSGQGRGAGLHLHVNVGSFLFSYPISISQSATLGNSTAFRLPHSLIRSVRLISSFCNVYPESSSGISIQLVTY